MAQVAIRDGDAEQGHLCQCRCRRESNGRGARDLARNRIRITTIAPGLFLLLLLGLPEEARAQLAADVTFPKWLGDPAEYAGLAQFMWGCGCLNGETMRAKGALR